jgi:hypothetical protein
MTSDRQPPNRFAALWISVCGVATLGAGSVDGAMGTLPPASARITDVRFVPGQTSVDVIIGADGSPTTPTVFLLGNTRLVIDLPDAQSAVKAQTVRAEQNGFVRQARIGQHHDPLKVRIVLDLEQPVAHRVTRHAAGLAIRLTGASSHASARPSDPPESATSSPPADSAVPSRTRGGTQPLVSPAPRLSDSSADVGQATATDREGNLYVGGYTSGSLDGATNAGMLDGFVVKYDSRGAARWIRQVGTAGSDVVQSVAADAGGNVYVAGYTYGSLSEQTNAGLADLFVVKFDLQGNRLWTRQLGTPSLDQANGVAVDAGGSVYVAGSTDGGLVHDSAGLSDLFLIKFDSQGTRVWSRQLGTPTSDVARAVALDANGNPYVTGSTYGDLGNTRGAGLSDAFVAKFDAQGAVLWTRQLGTPSFDHAYGIAADSNGNVYVGGSTYGSLDGNRRVGHSDLFVAKYNANGTKLWTRQLGTPGSDVAQAVSTDAAGNVYVAGYTNDALDGNTAAGQLDLFVVKYDPHAAKLWTRQLGTPSSDVAQALSTDADGNVYLVGSTNDSADERDQIGLSDLLVVKYDARGTRLLTTRFGPSGS